MMKQFRLASLAVGAALFASHLALAATPTSYNALETVRTGSPTLITLTAAGPSTVNSASQAGFGKNLTCLYNGTAGTGTPANVVNIQGLVPGTTTWYTLFSSASIATTTAVLPTSVGPAFPTNATSLSAVVPATWRVQVVLGAGTAPTTTATVSCTMSE